MENAGHGGQDQSSCLRQETVHSMLVEFRPHLQTLVTNVSESSTLVRAQLSASDATVDDAIDRTVNANGHIGDPGWTNC